MQSDDDYVDEDFDDGEENIPADVYAERLQKGHYTNIYPSDLDDESDREYQQKIDFFHNLSKDTHDG